MSGLKYYSRLGLLILQVDSSEPITLSVDLGRQSLSNSPKRTFYDSYTVSDSQDMSSSDKEIHLRWREFRHWWLLRFLRQMRLHASQII
jgi:hypothetical protein